MKANLFIFKMSKKKDENPTMNTNCLFFHLNYKLFFDNLPHLLLVKIHIFSGLRPNDLRPEG